jgi:[ribosomal protein S5]-alanine N-acetyltransferase
MPAREALGNMSQDNKIVFETERLTVRLATLEDAGIFYRLWTDPQTMSNVGFPYGLPVTLEDVKRKISMGGISEFQQLLIVEIKSTGEVIGECKLHRPDRDGIAATDVKLLPEFRGNRYGLELKRGMLDYLFTHTDCKEIEATPNVGNIASIKMQEAVGGVQVGESVYEFPESERSYTTPVHHYIFRVSRDTWQKRQEQAD